MYHCWCESPSYNSTGYIIKVDSLGQTEWFNKLPSNRAHHGLDIIQTNEGDYIVVGNWYTTSAVTNEKSAFIARYSEVEDLIWIEDMENVMKMCFIL